MVAEPVRPLPQLMKMTCQRAGKQEWGLGADCALGGPPLSFTPTGLLTAAPVPPVANHPLVNRSTMRMGVQRLGPTSRMGPICGQPL
jgi:hypothetical protein